jgi:hypothetical protein
MGDLIDDDILGAFAVVGSPEEAARSLRERWGGTLSRLSFYAPYKIEPGELSRLLSIIKDG